MKYILKEYWDGDWSIWEIEENRHRYRRITGMFGGYQFSQTMWEPWTEDINYAAINVRYISKEEVFLKCL